MPILGDSSDRAICRDCLTEDVSQLIACPLDENYFERHRELKLKIGYCPLCTDCLYEKTGLDLRRRPLENLT
jgi:hypothetical protein